MRGEGVGMLQELLQGMGYPIHDKPALFGTSTRDAVKDFQSKKGLKTTGIVDELLMDQMRKGFGGQLKTKQTKVRKSSAAAVASPVNQQQLDAITRLLIKKGIFSEDELAAEISRPQAARVSQPPLT